MSGIPRAVDKKSWNSKTIPAKSLEFQVVRSKKKSLEFQQPVQGEKLEFQVVKSKNSLEFQYSL